jgi:hypothetical protein
MMLKLAVRTIALLSFIAITLLTFAPRSWALTSVGSISAIKGTVKFERAGKLIIAAYGAPVQVGDKFTTGPNGRVTIKLTDGSQLELNQSSTLVLTEDVVGPNGSRVNTKVTLLTGLLRCFVKSVPGHPPSFEVHTPNAVASVRGTIFEVSYHKYKAAPATSTP